MEYINTGSRSNKKLKILHGAIAEDLRRRLGTNYEIHSLDLGDGKEIDIQGRYMNKKVDITILKGDKVVAGIGVKFVMQNSNNYFENMLGETANIRCNAIPYFQIFIIPDKLPYFEKGGKLKNWEEFTSHNCEKYRTLSQDSFQTLQHTPVKTLLFVVCLPTPDIEIENNEQYQEYYKNKSSLHICKSTNTYGCFSSAVVYNDYESFASKLVHYVLSL